MSVLQCKQFIGYPNTETLKQVLVL